jgi:hypothetical protein
VAKGDADRNARQLAADLASGRPIPYRRQPTGRGYYNPYTGQRVSEHYVVRVYRPNLGPIEREITSRSNRRNAASSTKRRRDVQDDFLYKKLAENPDKEQGELWLDPDIREEFNELYIKLRSYHIDTIAAPIGSDEREDLLSADGDYADTLVELGMRLPDEDKPVGQSPRKGHYIEEVVRPYYEDMMIEYG